jgi:hypothetical protein
MKILDFPKKVVGGAFLASSTTCPFRSAYSYHKNGQFCYGMQHSEQDWKVQWSHQKVVKPPVEVK